MSMSITWLPVTSRQPTKMAPTGGELSANAATPGSSAYYSLRFSAPQRRPALAVLLAWHKQIRAIPANCRDPGVARLKLQWWRDELQRAAQARAQHPLAQAMAPLMARWQLPLDSLQAIITAAEATALKQQAADSRALRRQAEADLGQLFELLGRCHGIDEAKRLAGFRALGGYCALVYLIRDFGADLRRGFNPLPADWPDSARHALTDDYRHGLADLAQLARDSYPASCTAQQCPPALAVRGAILGDLLTELEKAAFAVIEQRICLTPLRKLWLGWRASRHASPV